MGAVHRTSYQHLTGGRQCRGSRHTSHQATERIQRAGRAARRHLEHMGVNHGGADIRVAQQLLHRANIGASLQKMSGK